MARARHHHGRDRLDGPDGPDGPDGVHPLLWPFLLARGMWMSAVVDERAIRFNLRLLAALTAVFSLPDSAQGVLTLRDHLAGGDHYYGVYVLLLGVVELSGALLLARRPTMAAGRLLILAAAAGFYPEVILGLGFFERGLLPAAIFAVCIPAEAWVLWFLLHPRTRAHVTSQAA